MRPRLRSLRTQVTAPEMRPIVGASLTIGVAAGVFAIAFGVGAVSAGGTVLQACVMSLLVFTGASQFSAVSIVDSGGSTASALGSAMLLAARNGVYGLTMARDLDGSLGRRLVAAQLTIDETTAMATAQDDPDARRAAFWITGWLALIPAALIAALIVNDTFADGNELVLDARAAGVAVAAVAAWRRAPLIVVIVVGAAVTATVRQLG
jgi:predicted branched-subunit amino acid permease